MSGHVALVTGAGSGIGRAIATALAHDGCAVAVADLSEERCAGVAGELKAGGGGAFAASLDVTDTASVAAALERTSAELGPVEVLVNCAGFDEFRPFLATDEDFWRRVIATNYEGCPAHVRPRCSTTWRRAGWGGW